MRSKNPYPWCFVCRHIYGDEKNILNVNYCMLLGRPWLQDVNVMHNWGNNFISIEGNGTICTIAITKHLDNNIKRQELLLCYDFVNGVIDEEEDVLLVVELNLFAISTITFLESGILAMADAPPHSLKNSNVNLKVKTKKKGVGVCSLTCNISGVERCVGALGWGLRQVTSGSIIHTNLHIPNNKLVSA
jgi:hypothetical protein